jgi:hypothetical protein
MLQSNKKLVVIHKKVGPILIADELMREWVNESMG